MKTKPKTSALMDLDAAIREIGIESAPQQPGEFTSAELCTASGLGPSAIRARMRKLEADGKWARRRVAGNDLWRCL